MWSNKNMKVNKMDGYLNGDIKEILLDRWYNFWFYIV